MPTALYLHIGHGKTGSSYLQSALALSLPALEAAGFCYPIDDDTARSAGEGHISGGNFQARPGAFAALAETGRVAPDKACLISAESLFYHILKTPDTIGEEFARLRGPTPAQVPLHVLLYLRDPLDHAVSTYQQSVKRGGYTGTLSDSLAKYRMPAQTLRVLEILGTTDAQVTIRNYSRHKSRLLGTLEDWLGLAPETLRTPPVGQVNRSPTRAELELQRLLNMSGARQSARVVSDPLCNQLPDIRSEQPPLSSQALTAFLETMQTQIGDPAYAAAVPEAERPQIGAPADFEGRFPDPTELPDYSFSPAQLQVLAEAIGTELTRADQLRARLEKARRQLRTMKGAGG